MAKRAGRERDAPTEREPRTAILRFLGMALAGMTVVRKARGPWGCYMDFRTSEEKRWRGKLRVVGAAE